MRKGNVPEIMAILRHFEFNILQNFLKIESNRRLSLKGLRKLCGWDWNTLKCCHREAPLAGLLGGRVALV